MRLRPKLTQQQIVAYLQNNNNKEAREHIAKVREEDSTYQLLFDLIDDLKRLATLREQTPVSDDIPLAFSAIEDMLMRILAGNSQSADIQRFFDGLMFSPLFYERLLIKLTAATTRTSLDDVPESASDEELPKAILAVAKREGWTDFVEEPVSRPSTNNIWEVGRRLFENRLVRYAFASLSVIAGLVIVFLSIPKDPYSQYVYDKQVPYAYDRGSLRSPTRAPEFVDSFKLGLIEYMRCDYAGAIRIFESLEPTVLKLQSSLPQDNLQTWISDYYFYLGVSHFALARSKKLDLDQSVKATHNASAIRYLSKADSLAQAHQLEGNDREIFFLGLVYACNKQLDLANLTLKRMKPESRFYNESFELIEKLSQ